METQSTSIEQINSLFKSIVLNYGNRIQSAHLKQKVKEIVYKQIDNQQLIEFLVANPQNKPLLKFVISLIKELSINSDQKNKQTINNAITRYFWTGFNSQILSIDQRLYVIKQYCKLILNNQQSLKLLIKQAKNNEKKCQMFLLNLSEYYEELWRKANHTNQNKQQYFRNSTQIIIFCSHAVNNFQNLSSNIVSLAIQNLIIFAQKYKQLLGSLEFLIEKLNFILKNNIQVSRSLKIFTLYIKYYASVNKNEQASQIIQNCLLYIQSRVNLEADLSNQLIHIKKEKPDHYEASEKFFETSSELIYQIFNLNSNQSFLKKQQLSKIQTLASKFIFVKNPTTFKNCLKILYQQTKLSNKQSLILSSNNKAQSLDLLIHNSFPLFDEDKQAKQAIQFFFKQIIQDQQTMKSMLPQIQKSFENQFEYQFDVQQFNSACMFLCRAQNFYSQRDKNLIIGFIKSLLNMNQSIQIENKKHVQWRIYDLISVYPFLLKQNLFLQEVIEDWLVYNFPQSMQHINKLIEKNYLTLRFGKQLQKLISKRKILIDQLKQRICAWQLILKVQQVHQDNRQRTDGWYFHRSLAGKRIYRQKWKQDKLFLDQKRQELQEFSQEFYEELNIIKILLQEKIVS